MSNKVDHFVKIRCVAELLYRVTGKDKADARRAALDTATRGVIPWHTSIVEMIPGGMKVWGADEKEPKDEATARDTASPSDASSVTSPSRQPEKTPLQTAPPVAENSPESSTGDSASTPSKTKKSRNGRSSAKTK